MSASACAAPRFRDAPAEPSPFMSGSVGYMLARSAAEVTADLHLELRRRGVEFRRFRILAVLRDMRACPVSRLARLCRELQPSMTKLLDRMGRDGSIVREAKSPDRRIVSISLTPDGVRLADQLRAASNAHEAAVLRRFPALAAPEVLAALRNVVEAGR